jgi:hypothetical protein
MRVENGRIVPENEAERQTALRVLTWLEKQPEGREFTIDDVLAGIAADAQGGAT